MTEQTEQTTHYDVAVIGAGPAGTAAALRAAELGARVVVLEAARVGGTCVNTGCVPTRVLAKTARLIREARSAGDYGIRVGTPELDWPAVVARVGERVDAVRSIKREAERFAGRGSAARAARAARAGSIGGFGGLAHRASRSGSSVVKT